MFDNGTVRHVVFEQPGDANVMQFAQGQLTCLQQG